MDGKSLCSVRELVQITGFSESTIRRRIRDGSLASWQPGGKGTARRIALDSIVPLAPQAPPPAANASHSMPAERPDRRPRWMRGGVTGRP